MDFLKFVSEAVEKSNKALAAVAEVDEVYKRINSELKNFSAGELILERKVSTMAQIASFADGVAGAAGRAVNSEYFKHDRIVLILKVEGVSFAEDVAGWKQRVTGYPCILKFDGQELTCSNEAHLLKGMSELLSSVGFGSAVNRLCKAAVQSAESRRSRPTASVLPDAVSSSHPKVTQIGRSAKQKQSKSVSSVAAARAPAKSKSPKPAATKKPVGSKPAESNKSGVTNGVAKPTARSSSSRPASSQTTRKQSEAEDSVTRSDEG